MGEARRRKEQARAQDARPAPTFDELAAKVASLGTCDARDAPDLPGTVRVCLLLEDGDGTSAYFQADKLPELMRAVDAVEDGRGRTHRQLAREERAWARLRQGAIEQRLDCPTGAMLLLLWLYFRHPKRVSVAARVQEVLDESGHACLTVVFNRETQAVAAGIAASLCPELVKLTKISMPEGTTYTVGLPETGDAA
jgi:hypothetical protein